MQKILSASQIKLLDQYTIDHEPISSIQLMERACKAFVEWFVIHVPADHKIGIVCSTGNNGGDGLGIARLLHEWHYSVTVWIVRGEMKESEDFKINRQQLPEKVEVKEIKSPEANSFQHCEIIIDAIFGTGLSRPASGIYKDIIDQVNQSTARIISVDVPSGLQIDHHSEGDCIQADQTITFQLPKLAFLLPENAKAVGEWHVVDIGLNKAFMAEATTDHFLLTKKAIRKILKPRNKFDHKGTYGHALVIAGSYGKIGAAILASRAALRAGAGLVTVHVPKCGYEIIQTSVPEVMVSIDQEQNFLSGIPESELSKTIGVGPGLGVNDKTIKALTSLLKSAKVPLVIDADGLNIIAQQNELHQFIPAGSILTPHPKELERLMGSWSNDFEKLDRLKAFAESIQSIVILKGAHSAIVTPDRKVYFNSTGNPGMATAGSGDVLTGILTGLLAQGYDSLQASMLGVYLHGLAGDLAVREGDMRSLVASDLIDYLPAAFRAIQR